MRATFLITAAALTLMVPAAPAPAQDRHDPDPRVVIREQVRDVVRRERTVREIARAYQGRNSGPEQTERFSRRIRVGRDGRVSVSNIAGDIVVTAGGGDEVAIEAVKRTRGPQSELANVRILVDERPGRVDVRTDHERNFTNRDGRGDHVSVDYTVTVPAGVGVDLHSVSGNLKITGGRGPARLETISGDVVVTDTPKIELAKTVSGNVTLSGVSTEGDLSLGSVSGNVVAQSVKAHGLDLTSISGNLRVTDVTCDRLNVKSVSGGVEYSGAINRGGSYDFNVHSGTVRLALANPAGFVLNANSFSGSIRSDLPLTIGGDSGARDQRGRRTGLSNHSLRATYGDGSATVTVRTFSGDVVIVKR
jgi:DUF4097 and DUF4098 domain-containing protein YvlB